MSSGSSKTMSVCISGRVQGVGFRFSAAKEAVRLGVTGSIENLPDGSVKCIIQGAAPALHAFISWAHKGPFFAHVSGMQVTEVTADPFTDFVIH